VSAPMVIRTQGGAGSNAGAQHSKSLEAWFTHIPGIKVVAPATPHDAKGLLKASAEMAIRSSFTRTSSSTERQSGRGGRS
jgi:pyruvate/2-oxoglutarate/acetoin dehydrogenase E1 component